MPLKYFNKIILLDIKGKVILYIISDSNKTPLLGIIIALYKLA